MKKIATRRRLRPAKQKGAALILTVVVVMVLTTLGLAMVGFTTTEERTATSYRDGLQARATAEAGVRLAEEMFRDPTNRGLVPLFSATVSDCAGTAADYCGTSEATTETSLHTKGIWRASRALLTPRATPATGTCSFRDRSTATGAGPSEGCTARPSQTTSTT